MLVKPVQSPNALFPISAIVMPLFLLGITAAPVVIVSQAVLQICIIF